MGRGNETVLLFASSVFKVLVVFLVSGNIIENSVIFPKSAVAFLILAIHDIASQKDRCALDEKVVERYKAS